MADDKIITSTSTLNEFFYQNLSKKNKLTPCPIPEEFIYYSSLVLERYAMSDVFFTSDAGRVNEKILGLKLLECQKEDKDKKVNELKDVGDTILVQLGLFSESVKKKLTNRSYYFAIAQNAYQQLDDLNFNFYDIPNFYKLFASSLGNTIMLLENMSGEFDQHSQSNFLIDLKVQNKKAI